MRRLYRSTKESKIAGVCGGIGIMLDIDPNLIRLGVVFLAIVTAVVPVVLTYLTAWFLFPEDTHIEQ